MNGIPFLIKFNKKNNEYLSINDELDKLNSHGKSKTKNIKGVEINNSNNVKKTNYLKPEMNFQKIQEIGDFVQKQKPFAIKNNIHDKKILNSKFFRK